MDNELTQRMQSVFRHVFQNPGLTLTGRQTAADIAGWDSMTHMTLIAELEDFFSIRFSFEEVNHFKTVEDMQRCIASKLKK